LHIDARVCFPTGNTDSRSHVHHVYAIAQPFEHADDLAEVGAASKNQVQKYGMSNGAAWV